MEKVFGDTKGSVRVCSSLNISVAPVEHCVTTGNVWERVKIDPLLHPSS